MEVDGVRPIRWTTPFGLKGVDSGGNLKLKPDIVRLLQWQAWHKARLQFKLQACAITQMGLGCAGWPWRGSADRRDAIQGDYDGSATWHSH